jgi:hypothetical protein
MGGVNNIDSDREPVIPFLSRIFTGIRFVKRARFLRMQFEHKLNPARYLYSNCEIKVETRFVELLASVVLRNKKDRTIDPKQQKFTNKTCSFREPSSGIRNRNRDKELLVSIHFRTLCPQLHLKAHLYQTMTPRPLRHSNLAALAYNCTMQGPEIADPRTPSVSAGPAEGSCQWNLCRIALIAATPPNAAAQRVA